MENAVGSMKQRWEATHALPRFRPRYPNEEVVRWAFRSLDAAHASSVKVLDLGCGAGRHAIFLASEGFDVHGCDISATGVAHLQRLARERGLRIPTEICAADDLSCYPSDSFDAVLSFGVLYYLTLDGARKAVCEIERILKPNGDVFCVVRTDRDGRLGAATKIDDCTWRIEAIGPDAPSDVECGMNMLFFSRRDIDALFLSLSNLQVDRMTREHGSFRDDDWLIYAQKRA